MPDSARQSLFDVLSSKDQSLSLCELFVRKAFEEAGTASKLYATLLTRCEGRREKAVQNV